MSSSSVKRILSDITTLNEHPLDTEGVFWDVNESNIYNFKALIVGPKNTPYEGGFYFFDMNLPQSYPLEPPKVKYCTQYNSVRYNPNLYTNGTVCLSILNTWSGPSWTPCNTMTSILISILGLVFVEHPLVNEPGHEGSASNILAQYDNIIEHESIRGATLYMLNHIPSGFEMFKKRIETYFVEHFDDYMGRACKLQKEKDKNTFSCNTYSLNLTTNYTDIIKELQDMYKKLSGKMPPDAPIFLPEFSNTTVKELQGIASKLNLDTKKIKDDGKKVNKLKNDLYNDIKIIVNKNNVKDI